MAVRHKTVSVGTSATALQPPFDNDEATISHSIQNASAVTVYIGGADVTPTDYGFALATGKEISMDITAGSPAYAVVASGSEDVYLLSVELG